MPDPFATALAALFRSAGAVAADYLINGADEPLPINVIWAQGSEAGGTRSERTVADTNSFDVQRSDIGFPAKGDRITVADRVTGAPKTFRINGPAILDVEGMTWTCPTEPI